LIVGLVMNYHFVDDVVAGSLLGGVVAAYAVCLGGIASDVRGRSTAAAR